MCVSPSPAFSCVLRAMLILISRLQALGEAVRARKIFTAVKALEHKVESGAPFAAELATLQRLAAHPTSSDSAKEASPSDSLLSLALSTIPTEVASTGVSSFPALAARFTESVAPQLKKVSLLPEHGGLVAYLTSVVGSHALFEKEGWADGEDVVSTVARVKFWLANKDLDLAAREANSLSGASLSPSSPAEWKVTTLTRRVARARRRRVAQGARGRLAPTGEESPRGQAGARGGRAGSDGGKPEGHVRPASLMSTSGPCSPGTETVERRGGPQCSQAVSRLFPRSDPALRERERGGEVHVAPQVRGETPACLQARRVALRESQATSPPPPPHPSLPAYRVHPRKQLDKMACTC